MRYLWSCSMNLQKYRFWLAIRIKPVRTKNRKRETAHWCKKNFLEPGNTSQNWLNQNKIILSNSEGIIFSIGRKTDFTRWMVLLVSFTSGWCCWCRNTSLYFWNLRKILRLLIPINPIFEKIIFDPYVHLWGNGQGTKNVFKHILQTFATKWTFPSLTVVLIPISAHPTVQYTLEVEMYWCKKFYSI
jgi:hypothetical protein